MQDPEFKEAIYALVAQIPIGRVMTYGQVAVLCGRPRAAWEVGQIAHYGPDNLPWHRVVNKQGGLASGWPGGIDVQKQLLEAEGVQVSPEYRIDIGTLLWNPER